MPVLKKVLHLNGFRYERGRGVVPDHVISQTQEDIAHDRDPVLAFALQGKWKLLHGADGRTSADEIVEVVGESPTMDSHRASPELYAPYAQEPRPDGALIVLSTGDARLLAPAVRQQIGSVSRSVMVTRVHQQDDVVGASLAEQRFQTLLLAS